MVSVGQLRYQAEKTLRQMGKKSAMLDVLLLLGQILHKSKTEVILSTNQELTMVQEQEFTQLLQQRVQGKPISQLLGKKDFWQDTFEVDENVLTPRPDSETLIELVLELLPDRQQILHILELGVGSGCLLLSLLREYPQAQGTGVDISTNALLVAQRNANRLQLNSRVTWLQKDIFSWLAQDTTKFSVIISNPPYIPTAEIALLDQEVTEFEPRIALDGGTDGLKFYRHFNQYGQQHLEAGGLLIMECGYQQATSLRQIFQESSWQFVQQKNDLSQIPRVLAFSSKSDT